MNNNFNTEFLSDDELEQELDEIVDTLKDDILEDESKVTLLNGLRLRQMQFTHAVLNYITRNSDAKVSYKLYSPFKTMGSVSVEGDSLEFYDPKLLAHISEFASNVEIYPLAKDGVRMTFTFHGLTAPVE